MSLTSTQRTTLATDINGQASLATARTAHDAPFVASFYNALSSPAVAVWRSDVRNSEIVASIVTSAYIALTALQQKGLDLYIGPDICDATNANVRTGFSSIFGAGTTLTNLTNVAQRTGTRLEVLLVVSAGPPAVSQVFGYSLVPEDVRLTMGW